MPQKIKTMVDGKEVETEVFTADELEAQAKAKAQEIADSMIAEEREKLEAEKEEALLAKDEEHAKEKEELEKLRQKDMNFENLRRSKKLTPEQEAEAKKVADDLKKANDRIDAIERQPLETAKTTFIGTNLDANNKEELELFDFYYKKLSVGAKTMEDVNKALVAAFNATTGGRRAPSRTGAGRTVVNDNYNGEQQGQESEASREFGAMLGVKSEDKKRFAGAVNTGSVSLFSQNPPKKTE